MKHTALFVLSLALAAPAALADTVYPDHTYPSRAKVLEVREIIETVYEQIEVCRYQYSSGNAPRSSGNTTDKVIGGVVGGAAGSAVGKGSGRDAAAAVGAVIGSEVAGQDGQLTGGEIIGAVAGGLIGNQVGKGSGRTTATAAGALIGALVGGELQQGAQPKRSTQTRERIKVCQIEEEPKRIITGYDVELEYDGHRFNTVVDRRPGDYVSIFVDIDVVEERTSQVR